MRKSIISIAVIAATFLAASCQKENIVESVTPSGNGPVFTADIESSTVTKTTVERITEPSVAYKTKWESSDLIKINSATYKATPDSTNDRKALFTMTEGTAPSGTFHAYFPASVYNGTTATLPATCTYEAGKYNMPMYAESSTNTLNFKGLCAVLAVKVTSSDIATLKAIKVKSDKAMCGTFTVSDHKAVLSDASDASKAVTLVSNAAVTLDADGTTFYIAIPAQEYSYLEIYISSDGTAFTKMMCTKSASGLGTLERNTVYPVNYETNAVQLWAGGPFWSTTNIGASQETDYGQYFAWGYTTGQTPGTDNKFNPIFNDTVNYPYKNMKNLDGANDMATVNWGTDWSVPTAAQFDTLVNYDYSNTTIKEYGKCSVTYVTDGTKGIRITGSTSGYTSNSIFLPAAGRASDKVSHSGTYGDYWSSVQGSKKKAYALQFSLSKVSGNDLDVYNVDKDCGYSVRPVCAYTAPTTGTAKATIGGSQVDVEWVQLWKGGPKFAKCNYGATNQVEEEQGTKVDWATACTSLWGSNWRTPGKDEMDLLNTSKVRCEVGYFNGSSVKGFKFTGIQYGYTGNSIFLPMSSSESWLLFWASLAESDDDAYCLYLASKDGNLNYSASKWQSNTKTLYRYVRLILDE